MSKKLIFLLCCICIAFASSISWAARFTNAFHPVHVKPYFKKNGSFVQQHYRARPHHRSSYSGKY